MTSFFSKMSLTELQEFGKDISAGEYIKWIEKYPDNITAIFMEYYNHNGITDEVVFNFLECGLDIDDYFEGYSLLETMALDRNYAAMDILLSYRALSSERLVDLIISGHRGWDHTHKRNTMKCFKVLHKYCIRLVVSSYKFEIII